MRNDLVRLLLFLFVIAFLPPTAGAERGLSHISKACGLTGTDTSVVADVYADASPGLLLATIPNGDVTRIGTTDCYQVDLATTGAAISYPGPEDATEKGYTLIFRDDATNYVEATELVLGVAGADAKSGACEKVTPVYPTVSIPSRGITSQVIAQGKPNYMTVEVDCTLAFSAPPVTYYEVFAYDIQGRVEHRTPSATIPSP